MDLVANLVTGFGAALVPANLLYCLLGTLVGTLIGVLPGLGPTATIAMLLPITATLPPLSSMIMLAGIYYGAQYGGSTTAILINLPGESSSAVTAIDGYQMARRGRAGPALTAAALGSFFAGTVATFVIVLFAPPLTEVALQFGPAEYFSLMVLGLLVSVALANGSVLKAIGMVLLGVLFGTVGTDLYSGSLRFTLGVQDLADGVSFVAIAVGMFGLGEILRNLENEKARTVGVATVGSLWPSRKDFRRMAGPTIRGTLVGSVLGILPGGGAVLASFAAYSMEKKLSRNSAEFGSGAIEGVAAPESANNAAAQTSFIPMLTLGVPSNPVMALMIGAMMIQGITPGPNVAIKNPELFWGIIASMWIGNLMLVLLNLPLIGIWVRLLMIPYHVLIPSIMAFCLIGVYSVAGQPLDLYAVTVFGLLGYLLLKLDCEPAPFLMGFIIGPMLEEHLRRAMIVSRGDPSILVTQPISAGLLAIALLALVVVSIPSIARKRKEVFVEDV